MATQRTGLTDITKKFNPSLNANVIDSIKLRSKSTNLLKPKLYHESSTENMKNYDKAMLTNSKNSLFQNVSFQKRSRHQISTEIVIKQEEEKTYTLFDLYRARLEVSQSSESDRKKQQKIHNQLSSQLQCVGRSIKDMVVNQNSIITLDAEGKVAFRIYDGSDNLNLSEFVNQFFRAQKISISKVFSTSYSTFFVDEYGQIHSFGLNDRGQMGFTNLGVIKKPQRINLPFKTDLTSSRTQKVIKIVGGPFHSVILTNLNKAYYTGALYSEKQILNESFISKFTEITIKNQVIKEVECGLTSCVFLTKSNKIYIMGLFGESNFYKTPTDIEFPIKSTIKQIKTSNDCIYAISDAGLLFKVNMNKKIPIFSDIKLQEFSQHKTSFKKTSKLQVYSMHSSLEKIIFVAKYHQDSISNPTYQYFAESFRNYQSDISSILEVKFKVGFAEPYQVFAVKNSVYAMLSSDKITRKLIKNALISNQSNLPNIQSYMDKIKALQQENLILKQQNDFVTKEKKSKSKKIDKSPVSNINFNFEQQINPRTFTHDLQIQFSDIKLTKKIAEGGYGVIYKGEWKKTIVAVKIFKIDQNNTNSIKEFISQCRAMQALRHPNIVMFLGACLKPPNFAIVLEYCEGGTLWSLLQNHKIELSWKERINLAIETAKAMNYLHDRKHPIVHRDLKSLNILLDSNRRVKLADFGWTKCLENYMTSKIGTYQWMAPQVLTGQQYTEKADVFSFSIILWEIAAREAPYRNINGIQVAYDVANKQYRPAIPGNTPIEFKELTEKCWQKVPEKRPSFVEIIQNLEKQLLLSS